MKIKLTEVGVGYRGVVSSSINSTVNSCRKSSRSGVVSSWETSVASRVTIPSIPSVASDWELGLNSGQTRQNSDLQSDGSQDHPVELSLNLQRTSL